MSKEKDPAAVALAKKRNDSLSPKRRKEIAAKAAAARWAGSTAESRKKSLKPANLALAKSRKQRKKTSFQHPKSADSVGNSSDLTP